MKFKDDKVKIDYSCLKKIKESLTFKEVQELIDACNTLEEKALIEVALSTGIRRNDIINIEVNRVDLDNHKLVFWEEKKDRLWMVAIPPEVVQTLRMYIRTLPEEQRYLFPFSGRTAYNKVQKILRRTSIRKHIPFHSLRRTYIRLSKRLGRDTRFVMDQTGDTARVILEHYEGYTVDEMSEMMKEDNIFKKARETRGADELSISVFWFKSEIEVSEGRMKKLDDFDIN
ncbi:MAG: tyrosine-type recombinase/integrase [Thermoplasmatota archaeon]